MTKREQLATKLQLISEDIHDVSEEFSEGDIDLWRQLVELHQAVDRIKAIITDLNAVSVEALEHVVENPGGS